ncbi:MAG TPA: hypothetical protein VF384_16090 [Planctomycetota bacterium]
MVTKHSCRVAAAASGGQPGMPVAVVFVQSLQLGASTLVPGSPSLLVIVQ